MCSSDLAPNGAAAGDGEIAVTVDAAPGELSFDGEIIALHGDSLDAALVVEMDVAAGANTTIVHVADVVVLERNWSGAAQAHRGKGTRGDALGKVALEAVDMPVARFGFLWQESGHPGIGRLISGRSSYQVHAGGGCLTP